MSDEERRNRVAAKHRLAPVHRATTPIAVARSLVALHSTDPATVHLSIVARTAGPGATVARIDKALESSIVRVMGMRRTLWAVPAELVPVVAAAVGRTVAAKERRQLVAALESQGVADDGERWLNGVGADVREALATRGSVLTAELPAEVPALKRTIRLGGDSKWAVDVGLSSRVLLLLSMEGVVVRARPKGAWTSSQNRWSLAPDTEPWDEAEAQAELARRWLAAFGPASTEDLKWWTGWTVAATKRAAAAVGDVVHEPVADPGPWAAFVPALDPTTMGWKERSWYLGDLGAHLFDRNGNAGPVVWCSGRVVGGWAHRTDGEVAYKLLHRVGAEDKAAIEEEAARLQSWLDASGAVVKPRFPTPLQKELAA